MVLLQRSLFREVDWNMKKARYPNFNDYNLTAYEELKGDVLYKINGGEEIENTNDAVANAKPGDTLTRNNGEVVVITEGDITYAREHGGTVNENNSTDNTSGSNGGNTNNSTSTNNTSTSTTNTSSSTGNTTTTVNTTSSPKTEPSAYGNDVLQKQETGNEAKRSKGLIGKAFSSAADTIKDAFGGDKLHARLAAGQPFDSIKMAAIAWAITYSDDSICTMKEYGSTIYSYETEVVKDGKKQTVTRYSYNIPNCSPDSDHCVVNINTNLLPGQVAVSAIHSHDDFNLTGDEKPLMNKYDRPSETDFKGARETGYEREYLVTPLGHLYSFNKEGAVEAVKTGISLARDPWADYPGNDILTEQNRLFANFRPDPYIDQRGYMYN